MCAPSFPGLWSKILFHAQESGVTVGMPAAGHLFIEDSSGPSEFAHAELRRIVCAPDPRFNVFEMVAQSRVAAQARPYNRLIVVRRGRLGGAFRRSGHKREQSVLIRF